MFDDLRGKVILVTGASTGIGAAAASAFGAAGAKVAVHYNASTDAAKEVVASIAAGGGEAQAFRANATQSQALQQLLDDVVAHWGRIDVLVNNAGNLFGRKAFADSDETFLDELLNLNVKSVVRLSRAILPVFKRQGSGNIINVTSIAARNGGGPGVVLYAATKGFVSTLTRGLAKELAPLKVRVNGVAPGVIMTPLHERHSSQATLDALKSTIPMGRLGSADECAGTFLYLASDAASGYITGQVIEVNGGQLMP